MKYLMLDKIVWMRKFYTKVRKDGDLCSLGENVYTRKSVGDLAGARPGIGSSLTQIIAMKGDRLNALGSYIAYCKSGRG